MPPLMNAQGQEIGDPVPGWDGAIVPERIAMIGARVSVVPLNVTQHGDDLFAAYQQDPDGRIWTYMSVGPFSERDAFKSWLEESSRSQDPLFFTIIDLATDKAVGLASYLRIDPKMGVIEVGNISYSPVLQRDAKATEAMYLMMRRVFVDWGYRRYEWKCDALNKASRKAAARLGFTYEGTFRQAIVYKGRNRDTAWFSIIDNDWPKLDAAFKSWLHPDNFDADGQQIEKLAAFISS